MTQLELGLGPPETPREPAPRRREGIDPRPRLDELPDLEDPTAPTGLGPEALEPTLAGQARVEAALRGRLGPKVLVQLHRNRTTMISFRIRRGVRYVRLHALFAHASDAVLAAIADYLEAGGEAPEATRALQHFLERHRDLVEENRAEQADPRPEGTHHDLQVIFDDLNSSYFAGRLTARITWSKAARGQKRSTMRLGSYNEVENLIRVHPALDQAFVPRYFVASVVFHEMLHEVHGAEEVSPNKRAVHTPAFLADERRFEDYERARRWEAKHIRRLLRY
jgi:hypothetical protein